MSILTGPCGLRVKGVMRIWLSGSLSWQIQRVFGVNVVLSSLAHGRQESA